ncbi:hypothetical protein PsAD5_04052 [Pseudovibrio sp. Ad5]|nr:hypothetical protein PsAD5_04052 [Pseudovibrio sp. Ad5]
MVMLMLELIVTRDSVCAGDDCDAPHRAHFSINEAASISNLVEYLREIYPLSNVFGDHLTWTLTARSKIAMFGENWRELHFLVPEGASCSSYASEDKTLHVHFDHQSGVYPKQLYEKQDQDLRG